MELRFTFVMFLCSLCLQLIKAQDRSSVMSSIEMGGWQVLVQDKRHWLVDPVGNPHFILGVNHIPEEGDSALFLQQLQDLHFNCSGYGMPEWALSRLPGFAAVRLHQASHWLTADDFRYVDVFSKDFSEQTRERIRKVCEQYRDQPNLIGYTLTDTPRYHLDISRRERGTDWVSFIRGLPADQEGKRIYIQWLRKRYQDDLESFQKAYRLSQVSDWEDLAGYDFSYLELSRPKVREDDEYFLGFIVDHLYKLTRDFFELYDPGALLVSEKFKSHDHTDTILRLAGEYFDIVGVQPGPTKGPDAGQGPDETFFDSLYWQHLHQVTGKPLLVVDHGFSFYTDEYPRTLWHQFPSQEAAGTFYQDYLLRVIRLPYIVGYLKCQFMDRYDPLRDLLKQGLIRSNAVPYDTLFNKVAEVNRVQLVHLKKLSERSH